MFDPERDEDPGSRGFLVRLATVALIAATGCLALAPAVTGFSVGVDQEKGCLAIKDGWHADRKGLSGAEQDLQEKSFGPAGPSPVEQQQLAHAQTYLDWRNGPGACIPESRHRLILSGVGLGGLAAACLGVAILRRARKSLRRAPAELATA
jgi:hypothetical protein